MTENAHSNPAGSGFHVILADPPWDYRVWNSPDGARTANSQYPTLPTEEIARLPVRFQFPDSNHCVLFLWATPPKLHDALHVMERWGFEYKTVAFTWIKTTRTGPPSARKPSIGLGHYTRSNAELLLLGTWGSPPPVKDRSVSSVITAPRMRHSQKPIEQYELISRLYDGPYIELFARPALLRPQHWATWGDEV